MYDNGKLGSIRNPDGHWINTECFREEANHFAKYGYYCADPEYSPGWFDYWEEQGRRCKEGYSVGGAKVTADHYAYLNFYPIMKLDKSSAKKKGGSASKKRDMPDFWDGDYNYYWTKDVAFKGISGAGIYGFDEDRYYKLGEEQRLAEDIKLLESLGLEVLIDHNYLNGGYHLVVGKSRRKGYSFKNAALLVNTYSMYRESLGIAGAFLKEYLYPKGIMAMVNAYISHIDEHTAWRKARDYVDKMNHKKASFKEDGIEKGYKSEITALTFKDNPDAARGKDAKVMLFEEAGKFPNLKKSYMATKAALEDGDYTTGQMIIFGTGGDMEGGTQDFADMFYNPKQYKLLPFANIWDENATNSSCGFFHPVFWNSVGFYDEHGNSDKEASIERELKVRDDIIKNSTGSGTLNKHSQEYPFSPEEAFLRVSTNDFPVVELRAQLNKVLIHDLFAKKGQCVYLSKVDGRVLAKPDMKGKLEPVIHFPHRVKETTGCAVIYEYPISVKPPKGLYKIGYDPYRQDQSTGVSLGACFVYKGNHKFSWSRDAIVAEYVGRPQSFDTYNRQVMLLAELYNAEIMYENEVTAVKSYFENQKKLGLLASQPDNVINANVKNSRVDRIYGIHMNTKLKDAGEKYLKRWLLTERDVTGEGKMILNLETIYSPGLLQELIKYNRKGNFDRVMAFMMLMFAVEEEGLNKEYTSNEEQESNAKDLLNMMENLYKK